MLMEFLVTEFVTVLTNGMSWTGCFRKGTLFGIFKNWTRTMYNTDSRKTRELGTQFILYSVSLNWSHFGIADL